MEKRKPMKIEQGETDLFTEMARSLNSPDVPRKALMLRHSQARYLLELVSQDMRRLKHGFGPDHYRKMMIDNLGDKLMKIEKELR